MKKILTLAALTAAILTTSIPAYATADLPDLRISDSGQQIVEGQPAAPEQPAEQTPAQVEDLSPYNTKPDPPEGICYTVTDLNIHQAADANSPIVGTYKKGESISILGNEGDEWSYTNLGYVYNGYLCKTQRYNFNIFGETDACNLYIGLATDIFNTLDDQYIQILQSYEICMCNNPAAYLEGESTADMDEGMVVNGLTYIQSGGGIDERKMYLRCDAVSLKDTIYHELGHAVDFQVSATGRSDSNVVTQSHESEAAALQQKYDLEDENICNNAEYFAEAFRLSLEDPDGLEQTAPHIAAYVKRVQNSLKN